MILKKIRYEPIDVRSYCERWARWRIRGGYAIGPVIHTSTLLGKILDRIRKVKCPDCKGEGRLPAHMFGGMPGTFIDPCPKCNGKGMVGGDPDIGSTRFAGANEDHDPISIAIDKLVASWSRSDETILLHVVVVEEYVMPGTQEAKAKSHTMSQSYYSKKLSLAHELIEQRIYETGCL